MSLHWLEKLIQWAKIAEKYNRTPSGVIVMGTEQDCTMFPQVICSTLMAGILS